MRSCWWRRYGKSSLKYEPHNESAQFQVYKLHIFTPSLRAISTPFSLLCLGLPSNSFHEFFWLQLHSFFSSNPYVLQAHTILFFLILLPSLLFNAYLCVVFSITKILSSLPSWTTQTFILHFYHLLEQEIKPHTHKTRSNVIHFDLNCDLECLWQKANNQTYSSPTCILILSSHLELLFFLKYKSPLCHCPETLFIPTNSRRQSFTVWRNFVFGVIGFHYTPGCCAFSFLQQKRSRSFVLQLIITSAAQGH
jgi:hypothetical protein